MEESTRGRYSEIGDAVRSRGTGESWEGTVLIRRIPSTGTVLCLDGGMNFLVGTVVLGMMGGGGDRNTVMVWEYVVGLKESENRVTRICC